MGPNMQAQPDNLVFVQRPAVEFASNTFVDVPVILQYDNTPLIEMVRLQTAGYTSRFRIYNQDGIYIAKVIGSDIVLTEEGKKSNLKTRRPAGATLVCELDGHTLFEIRRKEAAALRTEAELFTPDGRFIRSNKDHFPSELISADKSSLTIGGCVMIGNIITGFPIGVLIDSRGSISIGASGRVP